MPDPTPLPDDAPPPRPAVRGHHARTHSRPELAPSIAFGVSIVSGLALAVVYWRGGQNQLEGIFLALALGGIGVGMVLWAKRFMPAGPESEPRGRLASTQAEVDEFAADFAGGEHELERRGLLTKLLVGSLAAFGLSAVFPIASLGPRPGDWLTNSPFQKGMRLVRDDGSPIRPDDLETDGVLTVFPEGQSGQETSQTLLIAMQEGRNNPAPDRVGWTPDNLIAYSKICTHVGCPVGLFEAEEGQLLCPCHQSTFDVYDGARPVFGPAALPLPQLPLAIDDDGYVIADGPFSRPIGPGFWNQQRQWEHNTEADPSGATDEGMAP
jgi:ubiquinol-cytochrome c reductase iron-sulfur subunit